MIENITANHEIPNNWIWVDLDQLCDITSGNPAPQNKNLFKNGNVPFVRVQDMGRMGNNVYLRETRDYLNNDAVSKNNMKLFPKGSVLFTKSGMSILLNQRAILGLDMHVVSHIGICLPTKFTSSEWIYYWLKSIDFKDLTHATTLPSLKLSKVQKIRTPLPPLQEQHRIVAKIEELFTRLDAGVEALKQAQAQLKRYRQSVLKAAVEGRLTAKWREQHLDELEPADKILERIQEEKKAKQGKKYKEPIPVETTDLPELPEGWVWVILGEIFEPSQEKIDPKTIGEQPYIGLEHIDKNTGKLLDTGISSEVRSTKSKFYKGDLLYGKLRPYLNKVCIAECEGVCSTDILVFNRSNFVNNKFFLFRMLRDDFVRYTNLNMSGVQHPRVNIKVLSEFLIALPPKNEQEKIIDKVENIFSMIEKVELDLVSNLLRSGNLRQSILKHAFEGKLVPQNPKDLPASVLLERIKTEKSNAKKSKQLEMF